MVLCIIVETHRPLVMWKFMLCFTKSDIFRMCSELGWGLMQGTVDENTLIQRNFQLNELAKKK